VSKQGGTYPRGVVSPLSLLTKRLARADRMRRRAVDVRDAELARVMQPLKKTAAARGATRIRERRLLTESLLMLKLDRPAGFELTPGQHLKLEVGGQSRKYTICSAPHEPWLELFVERQPGGTFTPKLMALPVGAQVGVRRASGSFARSDRHRVHVMVATVTGVAPFVSMIRDARHRGDDAEFHVLHGASYADELGYRDELSAKATYVPVVSRPTEPRNAGWTGETGRVNALLPAYLARRGLGPDRTMIYACGHPGMVEAVRAEAKRLGYAVRDEDYG